MASQAPPNLGRKKSIAAMSPEEVKEAAAAAAAAALLPPPLDTTPFETMVTTRTEPLEYARVLEIYDRKVDALNQYQEALVHYSAQAQPGQPPPLPPHFRYYLGSCLRAAGDEMTALEFFSQQISIYQNDMQHLVSSEDVPFSCF
jgi:tetratricopeptide (TPR) repeat protein